MIKYLFIVYCFSIILSFLDLDNFFKNEMSFINVLFLHKMFKLYFNIK